MNRIIVAVLLIVLSVTCVHSKEIDESRTPAFIDNVGHVFSNGKAWRIFDTQNRITYLMAIEEGLRLALLDTSRNESSKVAQAVNRTYERLSIYGFRYSDLVEQVNDFYLDSANLRIPVVEAYAYAIRKLHGDSPLQLSELEVKLRRTYNQ